MNHYNKFSVTMYVKITIILESTDIYLCLIQLAKKNSCGFMSLLINVIMMTDKMKNKQKIPHCRAKFNSRGEMVEGDKIDTPNVHIHDSSLYWLDT